MLSKLYILYVKSIYILFKKARWVFKIYKILQKTERNKHGLTFMKACLVSDFTRD